MSLSPRAKLQASIYDDPKMMELRFKPWGNFAMNNPEHPDLPGPKADTKMVWHPVLEKYVMAHKAYNYLPDVQMWLNKKQTRRNVNKLRRSRASHSRSPSRSSSRSSRRSRSPRRNNTRRTSRR